MRNFFESPELIENSYGQFLLRTVYGETCYLNTFNSQIFDEVEAFIVQILDKTKIIDLTIPDVTHKTWQNLDLKTKRNLVVNAIDKLSDNFDLYQID